MANHASMLATQFLALQQEYVASRVQLARLSLELDIALNTRGDGAGDVLKIVLLHPPRELAELEDEYMHLLERLQNSQKSVAHMQQKLDVALGRVSLPDDFNADAELDARIAQATTMAC